MALSAKERERIIEEEQLRYETRQTLHREHCAKNRPSRWLWRIAIIAVAYFVLSYAFCGGARCPMGYGYHGGWMHGGGKVCDHGDWVGEAEKGEPGQPLPPKK
jgi:hypothetical protein